MDWLDEYLEKSLKNLKGLQSSLMFYLILATLCVFFAYAITLTIINSWGVLLLGVSESLSFWQFLTWRVPQEILDKRGQVFLVIEFVGRFSLYIYFSIGIVAVPILFYRRKLLPSLELLNHEINQIKAGELQNPAFLSSNDEFSKVFENFEEMRLSLRRNQQQIYQLHEDQKRVNATFSHDLRTPLTISLNNIELIETFYFQGKMTEEMLQNSLSKIKNNLSRLTDFADTMKEVQKIEDIQVLRKYQPLSLFLENLNYLCKDLEFQHFSLKTEGNFNRQGSYDLQILMEVSENILSNAIHYAKSEIEITVQMQEDFLYLFVKDNGLGFSQEALVKATLPYYSGNKAEHFGLGLTICKVLVEKHGGVLKLANSLQDGAIVSAIFSI